MDSDNLFDQTKAVIARDFELDAPEEGMTEEELLQVLGNRVAYLIESNMEFLLSLMYRMDIKESLVNKALSPGAPELPNIGLAKLIMERQRQRITTKVMYKQPKIEDLEEGLEY